MIVAFVAAVAIAAFVATAGNPHVVAVAAFARTAALRFAVHFLGLAIGNWELIIKDNLNVIGGNFVFPVFPFGAGCGDGVIPLPVGAC